MEMLLMPNDVLSEDPLYAGIDSNPSKITMFSDECLSFWVLRSRYTALSPLLHFVPGNSTVEVCT